MFKVSFTNGLKAPECKASARINVATEYFYKFGRISQFLGNYIRTGNIPRRFLKLKDLKNDLVNISFCVSLYFARKPS